MGCGDSRKGLGALGALREYLQYTWASLEGFADLGVPRDTQGVLGMTGMVLRVPDMLFGIPSERFGEAGMVLGVLEGVWRSKTVEAVSMWFGRFLGRLKWQSRAGIPLTETQCPPLAPPNLP